MVVDACGGRICRIKGQAFTRLASEWINSDPLGERMFRLPSEPLNDHSQYEILQDEEKVSERGSIRLLGVSVIADLQ